MKIARDLLLFAALLVAGINWFSLNKQTKINDENATKLAQQDTIEARQELWIRTVVFQGAKWTPAQADSMIVLQIDSERYNSLVTEANSLAEKTKANPQDTVSSVRLPIVIREIRELEEKYAVNEK